MTKFKNYITLYEAAYEGNLGFEEMVKFYRAANDKQIEQLEKAIKNESWIEFKKIIKQVIGISLK